MSLWVLIMATAYWNQWNHAEIMSMHGIELTNYHNEVHDDSEEEEEKEEKQAHCCYSGCMDCLGFSWRDFM